MTHNLIDLNDYKSILCLNGELPKHSFFSTDLPIIAADGAANTLLSMNVTPTIVIGDLDSIDPTLKSNLSVLHYPEQDNCDFEKALNYLVRYDLLPTIIVGVNGGYLDHILNNLNLILNTHNIFYAPPLIGLTLQKETRILTLPINTKISIFGIPEALITTGGLQWELNQFKSTFPGKASCFNRTISSNIKITVQDGAALVLVYE